MKPSDSGHKWSKVGGSFTLGQTLAAPGGVSGGHVTPSADPDQSFAYVGNVFTVDANGVFDGSSLAGQMNSTAAPQVAAKRLETPAAKVGG
jgi:hypothetical protein